jgi:prolyl oligopeptidase
LDLTPEEIHQCGLEEVTRIYEEMKKVKNKVGFNRSLTEFNQFLKTAKQFYYTRKEDLLSGFQTILDNIGDIYPNYFGILPNINCEIQELDSYREKSAPPAYYFPPPADHSRPGYFCVNTHDLPSRPKYTMMVLTLHEAIPGHHLQFAIAQEIENTPFFRRYLDLTGILTVYLEGWALYSESLGYEMGMYENEYQQYGALSYEILRACRLVVDTGIHYKRWSRQQAINFLRQYTTDSDFDIESEVDKYTALPAHALSYKLGEIKIKELRNKAEARLGNAFKIKDFHDTVLKNGALPMALLEQQVNHWLTSLKVIL